MANRQFGQENQQKTGANVAKNTPPLLKDVAERALKEAALRRLSQQKPENTPELGGRGGKDPARFGDWEINGRAIDF